MAITQAGHSNAKYRGLSGGYVAIGFGRDAVDVALYNQFGPPVYLISQKVSVELVEEE